MDHLVVFSELELNKLRKKRRAVMVWTRKRREPPVASVKKGDLLYFKSSGGGVFSWTKVLNVKDFLKNGRYVVRIGMTRPRIFKTPFSVIKRDRRSWVVCGDKNLANQQFLLPLPSPTLADCVRAVKKHYRALPGNREIFETVRHILEMKDATKQMSGLLFLLATLSAEKNNIDLQNELRSLLAQQPERVFPLAIFRGK